MHRRWGVGGFVARSAGAAGLLTLAIAAGGCSMSGSRPAIWDGPTADPTPTNSIITGSSTTAPQTAGHPRQVFVRQGDTAYSIARNNGITVAQLGAANNLPPPYALAVGQRLRIPSARVDYTRTGSIAPSRPSTTSHQTATLLVTAGPGDTLYSIAKRYNSSVQELAALNRIPPPYALRLGQRITVPGRAVPAQTIPRQAVPRQAVQPTRRVAAAPGQAARQPAGQSPNRDYIYYFHKVKPGETLPNIAQQYRMDIATLAAFNQLQQSARLRPGQVIRVPQ